MHSSSPFSVTPKGITFADVTLAKSVSKNAISDMLIATYGNAVPPQTLHYIARAAELLKDVKPEDWDNQTPHNMNDVPLLAKVNMCLALANPITLEKYSPDQPRDWHGRWTDEGGDTENSDADSDTTNGEYQVADSGQIMTDASPDTNKTGTLSHLDNIPLAENSNALPYFDSSIKDQVSGFFNDAQQQGIPLEMTSGFRTSNTQATVTGNQYGGVAPGNSLHEAGFAFDINWKELSDEQQDQVLDIAQKYGLKWGGAFQKPDIVHFYVDPFENVADRRAYIPKAQSQFQTLKDK